MNEADVAHTSFAKFFLRLGQDLKITIFELCPMDCIAQFSHINRECRASVQVYLRERLTRFLLPFIPIRQLNDHFPTISLTYNQITEHLPTFTNIITQTNCAIIGSLALKVLLTGYATSWSPRDLNIATPRNGTKLLIAFLHNIKYNLNSHSLDPSTATGTITHSMYCNSDGKSITITESKETDSFVGVVMGTNHTASMNFISSEHFVSLYPIQTLQQHTTYAYRYPLDTNSVTTLTNRGYTIITDVLSHPKICCPASQRQLQTLKGIGHIQWSMTKTPHVLQTHSYSWRLGDMCLDATCSGKPLKGRLVRRASICEDHSDTEDDNN